MGSGLTPQEEQELAALMNVGGAPNPGALAAAEKRAIRVQSLGVVIAARGPQTRDTGPMQEVIKDAKIVEAYLTDVEEVKE